MTTFTGHAAPSPHMRNITNEPTTSYRTYPMTDEEIWAKFDKKEGIEDVRQKSTKNS